MDAWLAEDHQLVMLQIVEIDVAPDGSILDGLEVADPPEEGRRRLAIEDPLDGKRVVRVDPEREVLLRID